MILKIQVKKSKSALKTLGDQLKKTGFRVEFDSDVEISVVNIGRKSQNYIKKLVLKLE